MVSFIWDYEHDTPCHQESKDVVRALINEALRRWKSKGLLADNIAVLIAFLSEQPHPQSALNTATSDSKEAIVERQSFSKSGSHYYYKETLVDGGTIEYDTRIKLRGRRHKSRDSRISKRTGSKRTREEEVENMKEEVGQAKEGEEEFIVTQLKQSRKMSPRYRPLS